MRRALRFLPALAVMALIFALSAQADLNSGLGTLDFVLRKLAHMTIFGVLWVALLFGLGWRKPTLAVLLALLYAVSDEVHQTYVEGRSGTPVDVGIDALGVAITWALRSRWLKRRRAP